MTAADPKDLPIAVNKRPSKKRTRTRSVTSLTKYFNSTVLGRKQASIMAMGAPHTSRAWEHALI